MHKKKAKRYINQLFFNKNIIFFYFFIKNGSYLKKLSYFCMYFRCFYNKHERSYREND